jgi:pimeloyl-ACP methyl ester carboxylesterase
LADLTKYTTTNIVHDMEEARQWLGCKKIYLFGLAYGGRLASEYMRQFPSSIETVVLHSPVSTGSRMPLNHAKYAQATLEKLFRDCAGDSLRFLLKNVLIK